MGADSRLTLPFVDAWANATQTVFWVCLAVVAVAFVLSWFLKATPLRAKSALEEAADDAAAAEPALNPADSPATSPAVQASLAAEEMGAMILPDTSSTPVQPPKK